MKTTEEQKLEMIKLYQEGIDSTKLSKIYNITKSTVIQLLKRRGIERIRTNYRKKYNNINEEYFSEYNEKACYWAGFIAADGNIYRSHSVENTQNRLVIELNRLDEKHLKSFDIGTELYYRNSRNMCSKAVSSEKICNDLFIKYKITPKKSLTLEFPDNIPQDQIHNFIRGVFDGDGCCYIRKQGYVRYIIVGTKELLTGIQNVIPCLSHLKQKTKNKNTYVLEIHHREGKKFFEYLYKNATIYLERKWIGADFAYSSPLY